MRGTLVVVLLCAMLNTHNLAGVLYFGVITVANLVNILTFLKGEAYMRSVFPAFANIIASIMISRLMMNLRKHSTAQAERRRVQHIPMASLRSAAES